jgi:chorismate synthase
MAGNSYGTLFRLSTFGESHGPAIGGVIDGCPAGITVDFNAILAQLKRRKPGQSAYTTSRLESDETEWLSGIFEGKTTGAPIAFLVRNQNQHSADYETLKEVYRPSHADYTYEAKYGLRDYRGGGRSSARETVARVVAGSVAEQIIAREGIQIVAWVSRIGACNFPWQNQAFTRDEVDASAVRCPNLECAVEMMRIIENVKDEGDTVGGVITCRIDGVPAGLGEPVFDKLHAELGKAMLSINAVKGFSIGSGFDASLMRGSQHNDAFVMGATGIETDANFSGGIQGGISNGQPIWFQVAFKPVASIAQMQKTVNKKGEAVDIEIKGRHDPCVVPRAVPIVEAMSALVLCDFYLRNKAIK